ncbi:MAG: hypothetical protein LUD72_06625 [Bacteroidales bacterium]|nr:hypothetical protein [Bacteroidales bacterium]
MEYAERELNMLLDTCKDDDSREMQKMMNDNILQIVNIFFEQGHTGFTAGYALNQLDRLLRYKPILPLTGKDDEWRDICDDGTKQNIRYPSMFKYPDGTVYDDDAIIISDNGGLTWFTNGNFRKRVDRFPYSPATFPEKVYIEYTEDVEPGYSSGNYEIITDQPDRIKALYERKKKEFDEVEI